MSEIHVEVLEKAQEAIRSGEHEFVCLAVKEAGDMCKEAMEIVRKISEDIAPEKTYESWLLRFHPEDYYCMGFEDFKDGRIQWINAMIEYWRDK